MASGKREKKKLVEPEKKSFPYGFILGVFAIPIIILAVSNAVLSPKQGAVKALNDTNSPTKGNPSATVIIHEFSDYGCSHCKTAQPIINNLLTQYGDKIKFVHKDFPLSPSTELISQRVRCAQKQNKFFELSSMLFDKQAEWAVSKTTEDLFLKIDGYAKSLGIDVNQLNTCVAEGTTKAWVTQDKEDGKANEVGGTPTFFLNGKLVGTITKLQEELKKQFGS